MTSPYELLVGLALLREKKRCIEVANHQGPLEAWSALVVMIGPYRCVVRQDEVDEVIAPGKLTRVLGMPDWMLGIGYFRGRLLNVIDGRMFFLGNTSGQVSNPASRILVVQGQEEWFGIKVDELLGIRHVWSDSAYVTLISEQMDTWRGYAEQCIEMEGEMMPVLQARQLMRGLEQRGVPEPKLGITV